MHGTDVFWYSQMEVLFEDRYFQWLTYSALEELNAEGEIIVVEQNNSKFFYRKGQRYYREKLKEKVELSEWLKSTNRSCGKHGEALTKTLFFELGFKLVAKETNEYQGKKWTENDKDLDFIFEYGGLGFGVEVKNRLEYIKRDVFQIKMFDMCDFLGLIPILVARMSPAIYISRLDEHGGYTLIFKRKAFEYAYQEEVKEFWKKTLLPVNFTDELVFKKQKDKFQRWLDNKLSP